MSNNTNQFDWAQLAFSTKKPVNDLSATFIAAPRKLSVERLKQIIKEYLPHGNLIFGIAKEPYIAGFEDQPQFKTLSFNDLKDLADKVNKQTKRNKIYILEYSQPDLRYIIEKLDFKKIVLINGSWRYSFHTQPPFYEITKKRLAYEMISPFLDEAEARTFAERIMVEIKNKISLPAIKTKQSTDGMLAIAQTISQYSFDHSFQTGVSLGKKITGDSYTFLAATFNPVVPYQTYAMHYGASREKNFSPLQDLNHYDTVHAEVEMLIKAQREKINLNGTTLFINLLPCPPCSRMLSETDIDELVYVEDHSNGYAISVLEAAGKKVRRVIPLKEKV